MPRSRKTSQSSLLKRPLDNDCDYEASEKKRKNSDSSSTPDGQGQGQKEIEATPMTTSSNISVKSDSDVADKTKNEENLCTSAASSASVTTETDKRNRSLEALFVVTDNELQNISRHEPEPEGASDEKIYIISNLSEMQVNEEQIIITQNDDASREDNSSIQPEKSHHRPDTLEPHGLKLVYTKQASESSIIPYMVDTKTKRSETFIKSQSEILTSTPIDMQFSVGRKRKHPQKPGKHICTYCGRGCAKPSVLEKHLRAHTGERPFPCLDCGFSFKTKSNLYKHCKSRAHAQKVNLSGTVVEEVVETEPNEVELSDEEVVMAESETESASDQDDGSSERLRVVLSSDEISSSMASTPQGAEEADTHQSYKKKLEVGKLMEWNKNIEKHEKQRTKAILEAHSQFPIKIAPKNISGLSMDSITVPDSDSRPKLMSQKSNPEYTVFSPEGNLGRLKSLTEPSSLSVSAASTPRSPGASKGLSLPVVMSTETKTPPIKTNEPSITISTETVLLPHPSLGREAAQKGLQQLEELTSKLNSPSFHGIQISTSFNKLPNESMEVVVHIAKSAQGQTAGKSELKQKIEALVSATSVALATQPANSSPVITSSASFNRSDSKQGMSSEHIKEHIQHLISANAAIVDMPMSDAPRPRARSIFRQTSEITGAGKTEQSVKAETNKISIPNIVSVPLAPLQAAHQIDVKGKSSTTGKPLLSALSLPSSADIMRKENLARKTDQLKKLNELTLNSSQMLGLTGDIPRSPVEGISGLSGLTIPKSSQNLLAKSKTMEEPSSSSVSSNEFKIQIKLSKTQSETEMSASPQPYIGQPRVSGYPPLLEERPSPLFTSKEMLMQNRSISIDPKMMEAKKEIIDRAIPTVKITQHPHPIDLYKNLAHTDQNICKYCGDTYKHPETLKLHKMFYCTRDPESAAASKSSSNFDQVQKILIANYFQKGAANLKRSISLPDGTSRKVINTVENDNPGQHQQSKDHYQNQLQKKIQERMKLESLRQQTSHIKSQDTDMPVMMQGSYTLDQTPTDLSNKGKYMSIKPQSSTPILLAPAGQGMNNSPQILTPTSIPVLLASLQSRPLLLPQSAVLSDSVVATPPGLRSNSLAISSHSLSLPVTTRSLSVGNSSRTPGTPTGHFQAILPNSNVSTPLIGQPMVSPISLAEVKSQQQAVSDMKMRLKGKLLLKRSMSTEKMKSSEGSFSETISPGSRTPGTPISGARPFGDQSKLAQLLTAQAKEGQPLHQQSHNSPAKRPKLGELKQMNSGQLKAVDYTDIDPPSLTTSASLSSSSSKSQSRAQTGDTDNQKVLDMSAIGRKASLLPLQLSKNMDDKVGTMAAAIVIKEGSMGDGESSTLQFYTVPVVMAQPFFCETQALSSGYKSNLSTQQQQIITLISPTMSKSLPGSKTVKELLIQKSQEVVKSPMVGQKSFSDANLMPWTTKALQYDKGINSSTTQQLRDKLSTPSEKNNQLQLSPKRTEVITPMTPSRPKKSATLNLYGHLIATLRSTTHVSYCCVQRPQPFYVPMSTNKKISMYSNWKAAPHNPNPIGLSSKDLLTLYKSRYTSNPVYAEGGNSIPKSIGGFVTHSTYWTYHKQREGQEMKLAAQMREREKNVADKVSPSTLEKVLSKIRESTPDNVNSSYNSAMTVSTRNEPETSSTMKSEYGAPATKREKICSGGFRTNEEYTYIRGRGRGNYVCETCGIRCRKPSMLKKHIRTHTDHRPFHCRHCKFSFKTKGNLTKHMKSKAHTKKCFELDLDPCTMTVEECQIDDEELAAQFSSGKVWLSSSATMDEEEDEEKDVISLASEDDEDTKSADFEKSAERPKQEVASQTPIYVAVKSSGSNKPALLKISQRGISSSLGTVYGFDGTSYADRALSPDKNSESTRTQNIDTEIARSLLELSKKAEAENREEKIADSGEKKETRLGNLIGALMSRTNKPLSGLNQSKDNNSVIVLDVEPMRSLSQPVLSSPLSITVTDVDEDNQLEKDDKKQTSATISSAFTTNKRPRDLFLGADDQPTRKRLYVPGSPLKTPKETINPQTPLNASILSYLPPCISTKVRATKSSTNRGPIIGQLIQQDSVVMTPVVSAAPSSSGFPFQFSHPFVILNEFPHSEEGSTANESGNSGLLYSRDMTLSNVPSSSKDSGVVLETPNLTTLPKKFIYVIDDASVMGEKNHSADSSLFSEHKKDHHSNNLFVCDTCGVKFHSREDLAKHVKSCNHSRESVQSISATHSSPLKCVHCDVVFGFREELSAHLRSEQHFRELELLDILNSGFYEWLLQSGELDKMDSSDADVFFKDTMANVVKWKDALEKKSRETTLTANKNLSESSTVFSGSVNTSRANPKKDSTLSEEHFSKRLDYEKHNEASNERVTVEIKQQPIDIGDIEQRSFATDDNQENATSQNTYTKNVPNLKDKMSDGGDGPHLCGICRKGFKDLQKLRSHILTHAELRPYVCEYCDAGFTNAQSLKTHLHTHTQERPYVCGRCGDTFTQSDDLHLHMSTHSSLLPVKNHDQSKTSPSHVSQSGLKSTLSLDQSKSPKSDTGQLSLRPTFSLDQSQLSIQRFDKSPIKLSTSIDDQGSANSSQSEDGPLVIDQSNCSAETSSKQTTSFDKRVILNHQSSLSASSQDESDRTSDS